MKIGQLCFFQLSLPAEIPYGSAERGSRYQGQRGPTASRSYLRFDRTQVPEDVYKRQSSLRSQAFKRVPRLCWHLRSERVTRIELASTAWEAVVLPMNYTRVGI